EGATRYPGVTGRVHGDVETLIFAAAAQVGGVDQRGSRGVELGDEGISFEDRSGVAPAVSPLERSRGCREVGRASVARQVGVAGRVHSDPRARLIAAAAEVGGVDQRGAGCIELRHTCVGEAAIAWDGLKGPGGRLDEVTRK